MVSIEPLVEEACDDEQRADREERERAGDRAQEREVVDEELHERDAEEGEAADLQLAPPALQPRDEQGEPDSAPDGADRGVAPLERGVDTTADRLGQLEDRERRR